MRFSTANTVSMTHSNSTSTFKKVISTLVSKLPHHQQKSAVINQTKVHPMPSRKPQQTPSVKQQKGSSCSAITKQDDIHRNLRDYYTAQNSRKRQYEEAPLVAFDEKNTEREIRHKTVKQYQQTKDKKTSSSYQHWKEYSNPSSHIVNKSAPPKYKTHAYVRDTRTNPDHLRVAAIANSISCARRRPIVSSNNKQYIVKRKDDFQWGSKSKLSNELL